MSGAFFMRFYQRNHHSYASARSYAWANNAQTRKGVTEAYFARREAEAEKGRAICRNLHVGDYVEYCHEDGFDLHLIIVEITPLKIVTRERMHTERQWIFGGPESLYPAKFGSCHVTWPAMLTLEDPGDAA
jgi:hypothetical protein